MSYNPLSSLQSTLKNIALVKSRKTFKPIKDDIAKLMLKFDFLKIRGQEFFEEAEELLQKKKYNLAAFNLEQAFQLWIKYLIGKKIGDWPKTHYFSELTPQLAKVYEEEKISEFYRENELFFDSLEDAYFTSRYFPKQFTENGVKMLLEKVKEFIKLLEDLTGEKLL
ncbi:MAG: HEPN domain-containing protein [Methanosarcinales archaeon Met12]|nr:MAG: HEPN domain-containing protein [Methanosarcinales archaeon Met12]